MKMQKSDGDAVGCVERVRKAIMLSTNNIPFKPSVMNISPTAVLQWQSGDLATLFRDLAEVVTAQNFIYGHSYSHGNLCLEICLSNFFLKQGRVLLYVFCSAGVHY